MTRKELADAIATRTGTSKKWADDCVETFMAEIRAALVRGEEVTLRGFGTWKETTRVARICRNPRTGEAVAAAPKRVVKFKPAKGWTAALNEQDVC